MNTFGLVYLLSWVMHPQPLPSPSHTFEFCVLVSTPYASVFLSVVVGLRVRLRAYANPLALQTDGARLGLRGQAAAVAST